MDKPGIEPGSAALEADALTTWPTRQAKANIIYTLGLWNECQVICSRLFRTMMAMRLRENERERGGGGGGGGEKET